MAQTNCSTIQLVNFKSQLSFYGQYRAESVLKCWLTCTRERRGGVGGGGYKRDGDRVGGGDTLAHTVRVVERYI